MFARRSERLHHFEVLRTSRRKNRVLAAKSRCAAQRMLPPWTDYSLWRSRIRQARVIGMVTASDITLVLLNFGVCPIDPSAISSLVRGGVLLVHKHPSLLERKAGLNVFGQLWVEAEQ